MPLSAVWNSRCFLLPPQQNFGLIGLGLMGEAIAARLRGAGHGVLGFDIQPRCAANLAALSGKVAIDAGTVLAEAGCFIADAR